MEENYKLTSPDTDLALKTLEALESGGAPLAKGDFFLSPLSLFSALLLVLNASGMLM